MVKHFHPSKAGLATRGEFIMGYYEAAIGTFTPTVQEKAKDAAPAETKLTRDEEAELKAE
jgi:hypothetical protein